jgi:hypothetical protein
VRVSSSVSIEVGSVMVASFDHVMRRNAITR